MKKLKKEKELTQTSCGLTEEQLNNLQWAKEFMDNYERKHNRKATEVAK